MQVGQLPCRRIPVHVAVMGSPLVAQAERSLPRGLQRTGQQQPLALRFGTLLPNATASQQLHVRNTGASNMPLLRATPCGAVGYLPHAQPSGPVLLCGVRLLLGLGE